MLLTPDPSGHPDDRRVALLRNERGEWELPGGKLERGESPEHCLVREIQEEHGRAAQGIRDRIRELGGEPSDSSGAWGAWAKTVQGTMNLFGDASALKSLKEGEEHGLKDYQEALDDVDPTSAQLIQNQLIPAQQRHINLLDQLVSSVGNA